MDNSKKCLIMMASYNGEKYIGQQIQSIIDQDYQNWHLIIQDDGSTDETVKIVENYALKDDRIEFRINQGTHGPYYNFHSLINYCKRYANGYDYYLFSDHDDVWYKNKISSFINYYNRSSSNEIPTLLYADMNIINANGDIISYSVNEKLGIQYKNPQSTFFCHCVFGCNTFFNKKLFELVPSVDIENSITKILCHDNYYAKYAAVFGKLRYCNRQLMGYRRYGDNVTSGQSYDFGIKRIISAFNSFEKLCEGHARTYSQSLYTIDTMITNSKISISTRDLLAKIKSCIQSGGIKGSLMYITMNIGCGNRIKTLSHFMVLASKGYKKYISK